mgnify:CR=1 FL=1
MTSNDRVIVTIENGVADVRLNRPEKMNALDGAMFKALVDTGERLKHDPSVRAVVLSGEGRAFCAGLDKGSFAAMAGGVLMVAGVLIHLAEDHGHEHDHDAMDHEHAHTHDDGHHLHSHNPMPAGPHSHPHHHGTLHHSHPHAPDVHHRHPH